MTLSKATLFFALMACGQAGLVLGLYRYGLAGSFVLVLLFTASVAACHMLLGQTTRWLRGTGRRRSLSYVVALVLAGAVQFLGIAFGLVVAFNVWGT
jgi:hypothetical protein